MRVFGGTKGLTNSATILLERFCWKRTKGCQRVLWKDATKLCFALWFSDRNLLCGRLALLSELVSLWLKPAHAKNRTKWNFVHFWKTYGFRLAVRVSAALRSPLWSAKSWFLLKIEWRINYVCAELSDWQLLCKFKWLELRSCNLFVCNCHLEKDVLAAEIKWIRQMTWVSCDRNKKRTWKLFYAVFCGWVNLCQMFFASFTQNLVLFILHCLCSLGLIAFLSQTNDECTQGSRYVFSKNAQNCESSLSASQTKSRPTPTDNAPKVTRELAPKETWCFCLNLGFGRVDLEFLLKPFAIRYGVSLWIKIFLGEQIWLISPLLKEFFCNHCALCFHQKQRGNAKSHWYSFLLTVASEVFIV